MLRRLTAWLVLALGLALVPAGAASDDITLLYDTEFGGYVPVLKGIERPDLVTSKTDGRVPEKPRQARRWAKRAARRNEYPKIPRPFAASPDPTASARKPTRRWVRRTGVTTLILALDVEGRPIEGARVYRYTDPTFYAVNQDASGARLFGAWRFMPAPLREQDAITTVTALEEYWQALDFKPVAEITPNIDENCNPYVRPAPAPALGIEYVGRTGPDGTLQTVSGLFNLKDRRRFPRAVVPETLRLGFVITADGHLPTATERRLSAGGLFESRTLRLLRGPGFPVFTSDEWRVAVRIVETTPLDSAGGAADITAQIKERAARLDGPIASVEDALKDEVRRDIEARLWRIVARRASGELRTLALRLVVELTPKAPARLYALATTLLAAEGVAPGAAAPRDPLAPSERLTEVEDVLRKTLDASSRFLPAYPLLDQLLVRRGAPADERTPSIKALLKESPFDPWARSRMAVFMLKNGRSADAFDHLRYTYMAVPGLGGDRELALGLSAFYWKIGLPEKAGAYAWLLTGRPPEDPFARPKGLGS